MTRTPEPPHGVTARKPLTLPAIARAAARLLDDAAALPAPNTVYLHVYGPPSASLHLPGKAPGIWHDMQAWATRYGSVIDTAPAASSPGSIYASTTFRREGISYQVSAIITEPEPEPGTGTGTARPASPEGQA